VLHAEFNGLSRPGLLQRRDRGSSGRHCSSDPPTGQRYLGGGYRRHVTTISVRTDVIESAGLSRADVAAWTQAAPTEHDLFDAAAQSAAQFLERGVELLGRLPEPRERSEPERAAASAIKESLTRAREAFLDRHATELYERLTNGYRTPVRLEQLVYDAATEVPGLTPSRTEMEAERARKLADKEGLELAQGLFAAYVLAAPDPGRHLVTTMLEPMPEALERLEQLRATGAVDLGFARVTRRDRAGVVELVNVRHLNAEDGATLGPTEVAVDLALLHPEIQVGVMRGAAVEHPRYAGERIFGAGINLTHLYLGRIDFLFYLVRDLGYVNKLYRGLAAADGTVEKLWIATVQRFAIGGACQLLHVIDHVIATRGSRLYLPARKEGIIPGASNLRLPRFVGDRAARQAILSGREWTAGEPDADALCDEIVDPEAMEDALAARVEALTSSGLINAAANRRAIRVGQEPLDLFREYMATYAREQAYCHLSPALVRNLETHWNAHQRNV
jgi:enoyl-CoA hydratase/carnithine racemase